MLNFEDKYNFMKIIINKLLAVFISIVGLKGIIESIASADYYRGFFYLAGMSLWLFALLQTGKKVNQKIIRGTH
jgi:hypothetical protein